MMSFLLLGTLGICSTLYAQTPQQDSLMNRPPYLKSPIIPPFHILANNLHYFDKADIPNHIPVIIIYFNPDCSHCQMEAKKLGDSIEKYKNFFFVWVSYHEPDQNLLFAKTFNLDNQKNVVFGKDVDYFLPVFYRIQQTPFVAVYSSSGNLITVFRKGFTLHNLLMSEQSNNINHD